MLLQAETAHSSVMFKPSLTVSTHAKCDHPAPTILRKTKRHNVECKTRLEWSSRNRRDTYDSNRQGLDMIRTEIKRQAKSFSIGYLRVLAHPCNRRLCSYWFLSDWKGWIKLQNFPISTGNSSAQDFCWCFCIRRSLRRHTGITGDMIDTPIIPIPPTAPNSKSRTWRPSTIGLSSLR